MQRVAFLARRAGRRLSGSAVGSRPGHSSGPLCGTVIAAHDNQASSCGCASCGVASGSRSYGTAANRGVMFMGPNHVEVRAHKRRCQFVFTFQSDSSRTSMALSAL